MKLKHYEFENIHNKIVKIHQIVKTKRQMKAKAKAEAAAHAAEIEAHKRAQHTPVTFSERHPGWSAVGNILEALTLFLN